MRCKSVDMKTPGQENPDDRPDSGVVIYLSLFLLLFAFFIMLNAISQRESVRAQAAIGSLNAAFRSKIPTSYKLPVFRSSVGEPNQQHRFQDDVKSVIRTKFKFARYEILQNGPVIEVTMPLADLFATGTSDLSESARAPLRTLAATLYRNNQGFEPELAVRIGGAEDLDRFQRGPGRLALRRLETLMQGLRQHGVAAAALSVGIGQGKPDILRLTFRARTTTRLVSQAEGGEVRP